MQFICDTEELDSDLKRRSLCGLKLEHSTARDLVPLLSTDKVGVSSFSPVRRAQTSCIQHEKTIRMDSHIWKMHNEFCTAMSLVCGYMLPSGASRRILVGGKSLRRETCHLSGKHLKWADMRLATFSLIRNDQEEQQDNKKVAQYDCIMNDLWPSEGPTNRFLPVFQYSEEPAR